MKIISFHLPPSVFFQDEGHLLSWSADQNGIIPN